MGKNVLELNPEKIKTRFSQLEEMEVIWEKSDEPTKAYLEGCIHTANALAMRNNKKAG